MKRLHLVLFPPTSLLRPNIPTRVASDAACHSHRRVAFGSSPENHHHLTASPTPPATIAVASSTSPPVNLPTPLLPHALHNRHNGRLLRYHGQESRRPRCTSHLSSLSGRFSERLFRTRPVDGQHLPPPPSPPPPDLGPTATDVYGSAAGQLVCGERSKSKRRSHVVVVVMLLDEKVSRRELLTPLG